MTYADLMRKIVKLPGWIWEWKFGDPVYDIAYELTGLVIGIEIEDNVLNIVWDTGNTSDFQANHQTVPLPTVEQWKDLFIKSGHELKVICLLDGLIRLTVEDMTKMNTKPIKEGCFDLHIGLAILYARVVLGYKWDGKEFVKC